MTRRINIVLPETTVKVLDRVAGKGNRSRLIDEAVLHYVRSHSRRHLRQRLKQEALTNAERDLLMVAEWFPLEEEACQLAEDRKGEETQITRAAEEFRRRGRQ
jgi:CopG family transcriptional regulator / antitoxin EndoAI